jgi:opacity protein-like surface antigen
MDMNTRRFAGFLIVAAVLSAAAPAAAQRRRPYNPEPNTLKLRIGQFEPDGESQYWDQREIDFTGGADDFEDTIFGVDYTRMLTERFGVIASGSLYEASSTAAFLDFEDEFGNDIVHETSLDITQLNLGVLFHILRRDAVVSPYVGGGLGLYGYDLEESGEFIDFDTFDIFEGTFDTDGNAFGAFFLLGLEIPITEGVGVFAEGRWHSVEDELDGDFEGFGDIDLGGRELAAGVSFRF